MKESGERGLLYIVCQRRATAFLAFRKGQAEPEGCKARKRKLSFHSALLAFYRFGTKIWPPSGELSPASNKNTFALCKLDVYLSNFTNLMHESLLGSQHTMVLDSFLCLESEKGQMKGQVSLK